MARTAKTTARNMKAPISKRKPGRPLGSKNTARTVAKPAPKAAAKEGSKRKLGRPLGFKNTSKALSKPAPKAAARVVPKVTRRVAAPKAAAVPKLRREELRDQVQILEHSIATLRNNLTRDAKASMVRIEELEERMAQFEEAAAAAKPAAPMVQEAKPARAARGRSQSRNFDLGDAVPPGVAVAEPAPLDEEAETALENLGTHLGEK